MSKQITIKDDVYEKIARMAATEKMKMAAFVADMAAERDERRTEEILFERIRDFMDKHISQYTDDKTFLALVYPYYVRAKRKGLLLQESERIVAFLEITKEIDDVEWHDPRVADLRYIDSVYYKGKGDFLHKNKNPLQSV